MSRARIAVAYDARADEYIEKLGALHQMAAHDRATIEGWRDRSRGTLLDAGCGPGHWTDVLAAGGHRAALGIDGSARFLESARRRFPRSTFMAADLGALPLAPGSVCGILAWYSIIHTAPSDLPGVLSEFARVLVPGGSLLLGYVDGEAGTPFDHAVTTAYFWSAEALTELLAPSNFVVERSATRQDPGALRRHGELLATVPGGRPDPAGSAPRRQRQRCMSTKRE